MYKRELITQDQIFFDKQAFSGTTAQSSEALTVGGHLGALGLSIKAISPITLGTNKSLIIKFLDSDDGLTFNPINMVQSVKFSEGLSPTSTGKADTILAKTVLLDTKKFCKLELVSDDTAFSGTLTAYLTYLGR